MTAAPSEHRQKSCFAPIRVAAGAFDDPRIQVAARLLGFSFEKLFVRLQKLWSWATTQETSTLHELTVAELLGRGKQTEKVRNTLCHPAVMLARRDADGFLLLELQDLFGSLEWYGEYRATAQAGGETRASTAERGPDGQFLPRDREVTDIVGERPIKRSELCAALGMSKATVNRYVRKLLEAGILREHSGPSLPG